MKKVTKLPTAGSTTKRPHFKIDYLQDLTPQNAHSTRKTKYFPHANLYISNVQSFLMIRSFRSQFTAIPRDPI